MASLLPSPLGPVSGLDTPFPALRRLLGADAFDRLLELATAHSEAQGVPAHSCTGVAPHAFFHGLLVHGDVPAPDGVPARLLADVAAVEVAVAEVTAQAAVAQHEPRLHESALALPREAADTSSLRPTRALRLLPVAFRLAGWLRDVHRGRDVLPPRRGDQHVAVYVLPALREHETPVTWWHGLPPAEGRLLARAALGSTIGELRAAAVAQGWIAQPDDLDAWLAGWVREGLFAELLPG